MIPPSPTHSPRSNTGLGTGSQHSDFLGVAPQEDQLQELDIFSNPYGFSYTDDSELPSESINTSTPFSCSDFSSPWANSLQLVGPAPASSITAFDRPSEPFHDSYYATAPAYGTLHAHAHATKPVPHIRVETEFSGLSLDPRSPAFERSPTALMMPTPSSYYSHSSPSSSFLPATPQTPYNISPLATPYIKQGSGSPYSPFSPAELTIQPLVLEQEKTFSPPAQREREEGSHRVLPLAQLFSYPFSGELVPQPDYRPHTQSDRRRYVEQVALEAPILFYMQSPAALGIFLKDALSSRFMHLQGRDDPMFEGRGPSVSIRLNWPGYAPWSRQIPTRDFRSPPHPVTRAKLARNVAKTIKRFIDEMTGRPMEDDSQARWRVGGRHIKFEDLMLVGLQHVSMGSWQAHVRLVHRR